MSTGVVPRPAPLDEFASAASHTTSTSSTSSGMRRGIKQSLHAHGFPREATSNSVHSLIKIEKKLCI